MDRLKLLVVLLKAHDAVMRCLEEDIRGYGLNFTEFMVLEVLFHKGTMPIQKIGSAVRLTSGSATYAVDKLEDKGFLRRVPCPKDRRVIYAELTEGGDVFMSEIFPKHSETIHRIFAPLADEEVLPMTDALKRLGCHAHDIRNR